MICFEVFHESIPLCRVFSTIFHVLMFFSLQAPRRCVCCIEKDCHSWQFARLPGLLFAQQNCKSLLTKCRGSVSLDLCIVPEFSIYSQNISTVNTRFRYHLSSAEQSGKRVKLTKNAKIKFCIFTSRLEMLRANRNCFQIKPIHVI